MLNFETGWVAQCWNALLALGRIPVPDDVSLLGGIPKLYAVAVKRGMRGSRITSISVMIPTVLASVPQRPATLARMGRCFLIPLFSFPVIAVLSR